MHYITPLLHKHENAIDTILEDGIKKVRSAAVAATLRVSLTPLLAAQGEATFMEFRTRSERYFRVRRSPRLWASLAAYAPFLRSRALGRPSTWRAAPWTATSEQSHDAAPVRRSAPASRHTAL